MGSAWTLHPGRHTAQLNGLARPLPSHAVRGERCPCSTQALPHEGVLHVRGESRGACGLFVGFSDDRRFFVPVLVLFVFFFVIPPSFPVIGGISRRHHVTHVRSLPPSPARGPSHARREAPQRALKCQTARRPARVVDPRVTLANSGRGGNHSEPETFCCRGDSHDSPLAEHCRDSDAAVVRRGIGFCTGWRFATHQQGLQRAQAVSGSGSG
jgi:hypothetical protein